jgi:hypothetical protein
MYPSGVSSSGSQRPTSWAERCTLRILRESSSRSSVPRTYRGPIATCVRHVSTPPGGKYVTTPLVGLRSDGETCSEARERSPMVILEGASVSATTEAQLERKDTLALVTALRSDTHLTLGSSASLTCSPSRWRSSSRYQAVDWDVRVPRRRRRRRRKRTSGWVDQSTDCIEVRKSCEFVVDL